MNFSCTKLMKVRQGKLYKVGWAFLPVVAVCFSEQLCYDCSLQMQRNPKITRVPLTATSGDSPTGAAGKPSTPLPRNSPTTPPQVPIQQDTKGLASSGGGGVAKPTCVEAEREQEKERHSLESKEQLLFQAHAAHHKST